MGPSLSTSCGSFGRAGHRCHCTLREGAALNTLPPVHGGVSGEGNQSPSATVARRRELAELSQRERLDRERHGRARDGG